MAGAPSPPIEEGPIGLVDAPPSALVSNDTPRTGDEVDIEWDEPSPSPAKGLSRDLRPGTSQPERPSHPEKVKSRGKPKPHDRLVIGRPSGSEAISRKNDQESAAESDAKNLQGKRYQRPAQGGRRPVLLFLAVAFLVLGTLGLRLWRSKRQELPGIYETGRIEGIKALDAGEFDKAYQLLSAAKGAVQSLGGGLEGAEEVLQAAAESAIFIDLIPDTLEDLLTEAPRQDPKAWASRFANSYSGRSILIDAHIASVPSDSGGAYELDYIVLPPGAPSSFKDTGAAEPERRARIDLSDFQLFLQVEPKVGDHVVFGAKLESFRFESDQDTWVIRLQPKSGVFITHVKALESLGWPSHEIPVERSPAVKGP